MRLDAFACDAARRVVDKCHIAPPQPPHPSKAVTIDDAATSAMQQGTNASANDASELKR